MASVKASVDMAEDGLITRQEALLRIKPDEWSQLWVPKFNSLNTWIRPRLPGWPGARRRPPERLPA